MKKIFAVTNFSTGINAWLIILRICLAAFMLTHGLPKLEKLMHGEWSFANTWGIGSTLTLLLVVFAEFFCSILIALGLATRLACIPLIITMAVASFQVHANASFSKQELTLLYLLLYLTLAILGPGKYSIDMMIGGSKRR